MGKPTEGNVKGAQEHAEGQHGRKTFEKLQEINTTSRDETGAAEGTHGRDAGKAGRRDA